MSAARAPVVVVEAVRTPVGARNGRLAGWHAADLAAVVLDALAGRSGLDPVTVDEVILGCAVPVGDQGCNLARSAVLAAGWPESVPATTIDAQGASSLRALSLAADAIGAGSAAMVVAGGVEVSSTTPPGAWARPGRQAFGPGVAARYAAAGGLVPPGVAAEGLAEARGLGRADLDAWADESRRRAAKALGRGDDPSVVAVATRGWDRERRQVVPGGVPVTLDELVEARAPGWTGGADAAPPGAPLKATFVPGGCITAANTAPAGDAAAAVLLMDEGRAQRLGLEPLAWVRAGAAAGVDPRTMLGAAVPATTAALARAGLDLGSVDRFEIDESFAVVALDWMTSLGVDPALVNLDGGALARGLAAGAAGAAMAVTLVHALHDAGGVGLCALGAMGGTGAAVVLEAPWPPRRSEPGSLPSRGNRS